MADALILSVEMLDERRGWVEGKLLLSPKAITFKEFRGETSDFRYAIRHEARIHADKTVCMRKRLVRKVQTECLRISFGDNERSFFITDNSSIEDAINYIHTYCCTDEQPADSKKTVNDETVQDPTPKHGPESSVHEAVLPLSESPSEGKDPLHQEIRSEGEMAVEPVPGAKSREESSGNEPIDEENGISKDKGEHSETSIEIGSAEKEDILSESGDADVISETAEVLPAAKETYKSVYFKECGNFAGACVERFASQRVIYDDRIAQINHIFDIMNTCYVDEETGEIHPFPSYHIADKKLIKCRFNGIYREPLHTAYDVFLSGANQFNDEIIRRSIRDCLDRGAVLSNEMDALCLMPDIVDDFSHVFRNQLEIGTTRMFRVPRSIALAYAVQPLDSGEIDSYPDEFLCLDYDGEELIAIKIRRERDENDIPVFVRMGRFPLEGSHLSYRALAEEYMNQYQKKYSVPLTDKMKSDLINTKLLQQMLLSPENRPINLADKDMVVDIWRDDDILFQLQQGIQKDAQNISNMTQMRVYALCCFGWSPEYLFNGEDMLVKGCQGILKRNAEHKPLWEEYLPSLYLDVSQDGAFASLELIGEKDRHQQIGSAVLGNYVEIMVANGRIVLAANRDHYDLPLEREVYGNMNKEKLARFELDRPFEADEEVELRIRYAYGDIDSYKLIAIMDDGKIIESHWCDTEPLENKPPYYTPLPLAANDDEDNQKILDGFREFVQRVKAPIIPRSDMLYCYKKDPERPYSWYLRSLNAWGFPFRLVRLYFDKDNQTPAVKQQIRGMLENGTFDSIALTLRGELPVNHALERGTSSIFPNTDQGNVLRDNLEKVCREFGILYTYNDDSLANLINAIRTVKPENKITAMQTWTPITTYVTRDDDVYGVWESFSEALKTLQPRNPLRTVDDLRTISNVCYLTQNWIFEFYHSSHGRQDVNWLLENIKAVLYFEEWNKGKEYNARKVRDVLELLLCVCMLKSEDPTILDCNSQDTKDLVKQLKKIDQDMRELQDHGMLKQEFNSRIQGYSIPNEYRKVNPVIYCLVQTLSGGESINLVGFKEDGH